MAWRHRIAGHVISGSIGGHGGGRRHRVHTRRVQIFGGDSWRIVGAGDDAIVLVRLEQLLVGAHHHHTLRDAHRGYRVLVGPVVTGWLVPGTPLGCEACVGTVCRKCQRFGGRVIGVGQFVGAAVQTTGATRGLTGEPEILRVVLYG